MNNKQIKNNIIFVSFLTFWVILFELFAVLYSYNPLFSNEHKEFRYIEITFNIICWILLIILIIFLFRFKKYLSTKKSLNIKEKVVYSINIINVVLILVVIIVAHILITVWQIGLYAAEKRYYIEKLIDLIWNSNRTIFFISSISTLLTIYQITFYCILIHSERKQFLITKQQIKSDN